MLRLNGLPEQEAQMGKRAANLYLLQLFQHPWSTILRTPNRVIGVHPTTGSTRLEVNSASIWPVYYVAMLLICHSTLLRSFCSADPLGHEYYGTTRPSGARTVGQIYQFGGICCVDMHQIQIFT